jgi:selenocysteine-specific elongation factor
MPGVPDLADELRRRRLVRAADLAAMGVPLAGPPTAGDWYAHPPFWSEKRRDLAREVARYREDHPLEPGIPVEALRHLLDLPDRTLVAALIEAPLSIRNGRVSTGDTGLPDDLHRLIDKAFTGLTPFSAPEANTLADLGLGPRQLAAAVRAGLLIQPAPQVVLRAGVVDQAAAVLAGLPQPFTLSEARRALDTTRRVAVPLLELLDRRGITHRESDDRRTLASPSPLNQRG